jgi:hypothetical protein
MEETFDQKVIRNIQGRFIVYKTTEVVGEKAKVPNMQWEDAEKVDAFFSFANNLGVKVIYLAEGEEYNEETGLTRPSILQVGFLHEGIMHHINLAEDEDDEDDYSEEDESENAELEQEF